MTPTPREQFLALCYTGPLLTADAIVVLAGQDAAPRAAIAAQLFRQGGAARLVVTGRADTVAPHTSADDTVALILAQGIAPDRVTVDHKAANTHEQATRIAGLAKSGQWQRFLLVASSYHLPRAVLTVLAALDAAGLADTVRIVPVPTSQSAWSGRPDQTPETRLALLDGELAKCEAYGTDVATFARGVEYLLAWEGR